MLPVRAALHDDIDDLLRLRVLHDDLDLQLRQHVDGVRLAAAAAVDDALLAPRPVTWTMFSPTQPALSSASFTSFSFSGRMIASIFFICVSSFLGPAARRRGRCRWLCRVDAGCGVACRSACVGSAPALFDDVGALAVLRDIQADDFLVFADAQAHRHVQHLQDDGRHDERVRADDADGGELVANLARVAVDQALEAGDAAHRRRGEEPGRDARPRARRCRGRRPRRASRPVRSCAREADGRRSRSTPAPTPMASASIGCTKPEAGVMATRPATAPAHAPTTLGFRLKIQLSIIQVNAAAAAAVFVTTKALTACAFAAPALPALKPNQPNHRMAVPSTMYVMLLGSIGSEP